MLMWTNPVEEKTKQDAERKGRLPELQIWCTNRRVSFKDGHANITLIATGEE